MKGRLKITVNFNYKPECTEAEIQVKSTTINAHDVTTALANIVSSMCDSCPESDRDEFIENFIVKLFENEKFQKKLEEVE